MTKKQRKGFIILWLLVLLLVTVPIQAHCAPTSESGFASLSAANQLNSPAVIKAAIVSYLRLLDRHPELQREEEVFSDIMDLLYLLDSINSESNIDVLVSLSSYYLGEHGGEVHSCLLLRKGAAAVPALEKLLQSGYMECKDKFGEGSSRCLEREAFKRDSKVTLERIKKHETCDIE